MTLRELCITTLAAISLIILPTLPVDVVADDSQRLVRIESGTASFKVSTNMPGLQVEGKSNSLRGEVMVLRNQDGLRLHKIEASVPVKSLATGISVRDEHMRNRIFALPDGQLPDIEFKSELGVCDPVNAQEFSCQLSGYLAIRGTSQPLSVRLRAKQQAGVTWSFRAAGDLLVRLSDYSITPPSQFGIKPLNEVKIHLEFFGKETGRGR